MGKISIKQNDLCASNPKREDLLVSTKKKFGLSVTAPLVYTQAVTIFLLQRQECFMENTQIHNKLHPGLKWYIFYVLTSEDIDSCHIFK